MGEKRIPLKGVRKIIGERLRESQQTIPQVWGNVRIDVTELQALSQRLRESGHKVSMTSLLVRALSIALTEIPALNARLEGEEIVYYDHINPGIAVNTDNGLLVLTMKNVQDLDLFGIESAFRALMEKVKTGKLTMDDLAGGTVTLSNLCKERLTAFNSIINNDECLIVGVGGITREAVVLPDDSIVPHNVLTLTVNMNHTIVDGISSARFMERMKELLEQPGEYLMPD